MSTTVTGFFKFLVGFALLSLGVNAFAAIDWNWFSGDKVSVYPVSCNSFANGQCQGTWTQFPGREYLVNADQQSVVRQERGSSPFRMEGCSVMDKKNWRCVDAGGLAEGMTQGEHFQRYETFLAPSQHDGSIRYVPKWKWNWYYAGQQKP